MNSNFEKWLGLFLASAFSFLILFSFFWQIYLFARGEKSIGGLAGGVGNPLIYEDSRAW